ncbi:endolytic transglycosylase MltG [Parvularcula sp. IMCC14364]|uniref:endolytic transglycosylase MltG n=1 Tax=Parvularcula sp. IMCC14364 TaxID=3067902 RepID=UPI00274266B0|nr:endolytic transglycosylase MltG [Parvularcula sp. IMCC14364]
MGTRAGIRNAQHGGVIKSLLFFFLFLIFIGGVVAAGAAYKIHEKITQPGPLAEEKIIWVKSGMGVNRIADLLVSEQAIESDIAFKIAVRLRKVQSSLQAGEYLIPAGASIEEIIVILSEGSPYLRRITFPEGITTQQALRVLESNDKLSGELTLSPYEGALLPETYAFVRGDERDEIVRRMQTAQQDLLDTLWQERAADLPIETKEQAVILASIVEKETGVDGERGKVASVFVNRLRRGMRLESDPTVIYGITAGEPLGRGLRVSELRGETPYNTYVIRGLPPTPIANPGEDAIAAVLNPTDTDYIFFVADGTGGHAFSKTLAEHNANVRKWRQIERERNSN